MCVLDGHPILQKPPAIWPSAIDFIGVVIPSISEIWLSISLRLSHLCSVLIATLHVSWMMIRYMIVFRCRYSDEYNIISQRYKRFTPCLIYSCVSWYAKIWMIIHADILYPYHTLLRAEYISGKNKWHIRNQALTKWNETVPNIWSFDPLYTNSSVLNTIGLSISCFDNQCRYDNKIF